MGQNQFNRDPSWKYNGQEADLMKQVEISNKTLRAWGCNYKKGKIYVHWSVALEKVKGMYLIERSFDKLQWSIVGTKKGIGTNLPVFLTYFITDNINEPGTYFYRITKFHKDKSYYESQVMTLVVTKRQAEKMERHMDFDPNRRKRRKRFIFF